MTEVLPGVHAALHQRFHDGLREIARHVEAPDATPEDYEQAIREQWESEGRIPPQRDGGV